MPPKITSGASAAQIAPLLDCRIVAQLGRGVIGMFFFLA